MMPYRSPTNGQALVADTEHSLRSATGERWPVIDGIAYLRNDAPRLVENALALLDSGDRKQALVKLLAQNDRWWNEPPPGEADLYYLVDNAGKLSLREAMNLLAFGRVGTYFAHRWSDPTYMAGLALLDAHWQSPKTAFELACGIGHYLLALDGAGVMTHGADIVFAKLWLARHWVVSSRTQLVCFNADALWPVETNHDLVLCQDAFYFFSDHQHVARSLAQLASRGQVVVDGRAGSHSKPTRRLVSRCSHLR
jgi:predicted nicotinamide N-methyase